MTFETLPIPTKRVAKADVGLSAVDNTADASKPVSTAQASAIAAAVSAHANAANPHPGYLTPAEADALYAPIGSTGTGSTNLSTTQSATTVTVASDTGGDAILPAATGSAAGIMSAAQASSVAGIGAAVSAGVAAHVAASDPHPGYLTQAEADALYAALGSTGPGATNLTTTRNGTTVTVASDTGTDATLPAATTTDAGVMSAAQATQLVEAAAVAAFVKPTAVAFSTAIPFTGTLFMPQTLVTGALTFTVAASPQQGAGVYLRLVANGSNIPNFSAFKQTGAGLDWDNRTGIENQIFFWYDGAQSWVTFSQEVNAAPVPVPATGVTMSGPSSGVTGVASTNFTIGVTPGGSVITGSVVVTPAATGGGTFTPTTRTLTAGSPTATFTYTPASTGSKTISVTNNGGLTNPSSITYTSVAAATAPGAPTIGTATAGAGQATVTWTAPASDGGSAITGYLITSSLGPTLTVGNVLTGTITGLATTAQTFTVQAINAIGTGSASAASNSVTPTAAPTYLRLNNLSAGLAESGTGPYTYTGSGETYGGTAIGGTLSKTFASGVDGEFRFQFTGYGTPSGGEAMVGVKSSATLVAFASLPYSMYTQASGAKYMGFASGSAGGDANVVVPANGDIVSVTRVGTTLTFRVSKDSGSTWTNIHVWTGVSTGVLYIQVVQGTAVGTIHTMFETGLV